MSERKYSVSDIDRMRLAIKILDRQGGTDISMTARREEYLRTYMVNGTDPLELEKAVEAAWGCPIDRLTIY